MIVDIKDKKTLIIGGGIFTGIIVAAVGIGIVVLSDDKEATSGSGFATNTPSLAQVAQEPGVLSIEPMQIQMTRTASGAIEGIATVSALFQNFRTTDIKLSDPKYTWKSDCISNGAILASGNRCNIVITYNEQSGVIGVPTDPSAIPALIINGQSTTPGGATIPIETKASIVNFDPNAAAFQGADPYGNPALTSGQPAPTNIDPYGPVPQQGYQAPPVDYAQAPVPQTQPTLSPREQFMLARRQAVFNGMRPNNSSAQPSKPKGGWDELNIPTSMSSMPQDMSRVVTMDRIITAALVRPYDSRTSQQVIAQVDRNVYGAHGRNILIPRGSTLIGNASGGAERVAINWTQLIRPDGARFRIEASSADASGQGGVPGRVNQRLLKRYGSILLGTALNIGTAKTFKASETPGGEYGQSARNNGAIISDMVRQDIEKITQDIVARNSKIEPVISVPAGTRITVVPTMDLQLRPLTGREIQAQNYPRMQNAGAPAPRFEMQEAQQQQGQAAPNSPDIQFNNPTPTPQPNYGNPNPQVALPTADAPPMGPTPPWSSN